MALRAVPALACTPALAALLAGLASAQVVALAPPGVPAFREALAGMKEVVGSELVILEIDAGGLEKWLAGIGDGPMLVATFGSSAAGAALQCRWRFRVLATMVLAAELPSGAGCSRDPVAVVSVEPPVPALLERIHALFPRARRVGVILGPAQGPAVAPGLRQAGHTLGLVVEPRYCMKVQELLEAVAQMGGQVDVLLCLPDATLYNRATVEPFLLAALKRGLPVVAFSEGFVRAGAAVGLYPDWRDLGRQTGEVALKLLQGEPVPPVVRPRRIVAAVNPKVIRLLGIEREMALRDVVVVK